jgi:hypothetical protein
VNTGFDLLVYDGVPGGPAYCIKIFCELLELRFVAISCAGLLKVPERWKFRCSVRSMLYREPFLRIQPLFINERRDFIYLVASLHIGLC